MPYYPRPLPTAAERFEAKFVRIPIAGCWLWTAAADLNGYGRFRGPDGKTVLAHRFAYQLYRGQIPVDRFLCHSCDVPTCCNPWHMFVGTQKENMVDAKQKGRIPAGSKHYAASIPEDVVRAVRVAKGLYREIAQRYGICQITVGKIKRGTSWGSVT